MLTKLFLTDKMKPGSIFISFTKRLPSPAFEVLEKKLYSFNEERWKKRKVKIRRRNLDEYELGLLFYSIVMRPGILVVCTDFHYKTLVTPDLL